MAKVIIKPNTEFTPINQYERHTEDAVNGKIVEKFVNDRTFTRAPNTRFCIMPLPSKKLGGHLNTGGLLEMIPNPYADEDVYRSAQFEKVFKGQEEALRQHVLEYKHNKPFDYYTNRTDINGYKKSFKDKLEQIPYMQTRAARLDLEDGATVLDLTNPVQEVLYYIALGHKLVANSFAEIDQERFYISEEKEEAKEARRKQRVRNTAVAHLEEVASLGDNTLVKFCKALNVPRGPKLRLNEDQAYNLLNDLLAGPEDGARGFEKIFKIFKDPGRKREFEAMAKLSDLVDTDIFFQRGASFFWSQPTDADGVTPDPIEFPRKSAAIEFLTAKKNQPEHETIDRQLAAKLGI